MNKKITFLLKNLTFNFENQNLLELIDKVKKAANTEELGSNPNSRPVIHSWLH